MKKILCVMMLALALIIGGCNVSKIEIESTDNEIKVSATNASESGGSGNIKVLDGSAIHVDAKISAGKLIIKVDDKEYEIDKTSETFIDVPAGEYNLFFTAEDGLTGEIILRPLPRV